MKKLRDFLRKPIVNLSIILILSIGALYITMRDDFFSVVKAVLSIHPLWFLVFAGWVLLHQYVMGVILTLITKSIKPSYTYLQGFINSVSTSFFNGVSPGATGGQLSLLYLNSKQGISGSDSSSIMWFEFMIYQGSLSLTVFTLLLLGRNYFWYHHANLLPFIIAGFVVSVGIFVILWAIVKFKGLYNFIAKVVVKIGLKLRLIKNKEKFINNLDAQIINFEKETENYKNNPKLTSVVLLLNIIRNLMHFAFPFVVIYIVVPNVTFEMLLPSMTLMACVDLIDVFFIVPGAAGMTELLFDTLFAGLFISMGLNVALVSSVLLIWRFFSYYFIMIFGAMTFSLFKFYHLNHLPNNQDNNIVK